MSYVKIVKQIRETLLLSQEELAQKLSVSFATVNRWETARTEPSIKAKRKIQELCEKNNISTKENS